MIGKCRKVVWMVWALVETGEGLSVWGVLMSLGGWFAMPFGSKSGGTSM